MMLSETEIRDSLRGHLARNEELLNGIRDRGLPLDKLYFIEHHFWAPERNEAVALAKSLYEQGYLVLVIAPSFSRSGFRQWNVEAGMRRTFSDAADPVLTGAIVQMAARFDSVYDGWAASVEVG